jgi:hypothetical protein
MKRNLLLFTALFFITIAKAQLTTVWEKSAGSSYSWFTTSSSNTTGCAYNPLTNKLLLADRNNLIAIINVTNGNSEGTLTTRHMLVLKHINGIKFVLQPMELFMEFR